MEVRLTNTHIFSFFPYYGDGKESMTLIQVFTIPDDQPLAGNTHGILRLSHEGIMFHRTPCAVIRNSIVDPVTGFISMRFLCQWVTIDYDGLGTLHPECVDVTLPKPSPVGVSPITVRWHEVLTSRNEPIHQDLGRSYNFFDSLGDGYARGLFTKSHHYPGVAEAHVVRSVSLGEIVKFTIDATRDRCMATLGQGLPLPVEWMHFKLHGMDILNRSSLMRFDGIRGRLCYIRFEEDQMVRVPSLVVIDVE
jgi:hypothetical protein